MCVCACVCVRVHLVVVVHRPSACSVISIVSDSLHGLQPARLLCQGILQARTLQWAATLLSRRSFQPGGWTCVRLCLLPRRQILCPMSYLGSPRCGSDNKRSTCKAGDLGSIPGYGRCPRGGHSNPLQYSCLENHIDRSLVGYRPWGCTELDTTEWRTHSQTYLCLGKCG